MIRPQLKTLVARRPAAGLTQVMDIEDEVSDLSESGSKDDPEEIKVLKAWYYESS